MQLKYYEIIFLNTGKRNYYVIVCKCFNTKSMYENFRCYTFKNLVPKSTFINRNYWISDFVLIIVYVYLQMSKCTLKSRLR